MLKLETKMNIQSTADLVYEAFVAPTQLQKFWFTQSSDRWETGKTIELGYSEYAVEPFEIKIISAQPCEEITFSWGEKSIDERIVSIKIIPNDDKTVVVSVCESGFVEHVTLTDLLVNSKGGWVFMLTCLKAYLENNVDSLKLGLFVD